MHDIKLNRLTRVMTALQCFALAHVFSAPEARAQVLKTGAPASVGVGQAAGATAAGSLTAPSSFAGMTATLATPALGQTPLPAPAIENAAPADAAAPAALAAPAAANAQAPAQSDAIRSDAVAPVDEVPSVEAPGVVGRSSSAGSRSGVRPRDAGKIAETKIAEAEDAWLPKREIVLTQEGFGIADAARPGPGSSQPTTSRSSSSRRAIPPPLPVRASDLPPMRPLMATPVTADMLMNLDDETLPFESIPAENLRDTARIGTFREAHLLTEAKPALFPTGFRDSTGIVVPIILPLGSRRVMRHPPDEGRLQYADLSEPVVLFGYPYAGGEAGFERVLFHANGMPSQGRLAWDWEVAGIKFPKHSEIGRDRMGRVVSVRLSRGWRVGDFKYPQGGLFKFVRDQDGRDALASFEKPDPTDATRLGKIVSFKNGLPDQGFLARDTSIAGVVLPVYSFVQLDSERHVSSVLIHWTWSVHGYSYRPGTVFRFARAADGRDALSSYEETEEDSLRARHASVPFMAGDPSKPQRGYLFDDASIGGLVIPGSSLVENDEHGPIAATLAEDSRDPISGRIYPKAGVVTFAYNARKGQRRVKSFRPPKGS